MSGPVEVVMLGAGGHSRSIASWLPTSRFPASAVEFCAKGVAPRRSELPVIVGIGDNDTRRRVMTHDVIELLSGAALHRAWASDAHIACPACVSWTAQVFPMAYISASARVYGNTIVNTGAIVEHDCHVGPHAHVAPGAILCGGVLVGEGALVGAGAVITPGKEIKPWTTVKAGTRA